MKDLFIRQVANGWIVKPHYCGPVSNDMDTHVFRSVPELVEGLGALLDEAPGAKVHDDTPKAEKPVHPPGWGGTGTGYPPFAPVPVTPLPPNQIDGPPYQTTCKAESPAVSEHHESF